MDDRTEADFGVARKAHKRGGKNVSSSKRLSSASRVMAPPSFLKVSAGVGASSRHLSFSGTSSMSFLLDSLLSLMRVIKTKSLVGNKGSYITMKGFARIIRSV